MISLSSNPPLDAILDAAASGGRISVDDALRLATSASLADLALAADGRRNQLHPGRRVSYIVERNVNYTNVCNVYCRFCAFYRAPGRRGGYTLSRDELAAKIEETVAAGGIQILLQGGLNPELGIDYYVDLFRWIKAHYAVNLHALSADEILHIGRVSGLSVQAVLARLIEAGMGSLPGGGAEILVDDVRQRIARLKSTSDEWLEVHRTAHRLGITSTCTMMFGVRESWADRLLHLEKLRRLQDESAGFTAFITWPYQQGNLAMPKGNTSAAEYLRVQAVARLFLDNIPHLQSSWVTQGPSIGQIALDFGADDFGAVMFEENVVSAAGTTYRMNAELIETHIRRAGYVPWRRDVHYQAAKDEG
jgi:cyclic dehypoxanthinyl futalosine synthase